MNISKDIFFSIGSKLNIPQEKIEAFWSELEQVDNPCGSTPFAKYLFYFGAMVVIAAMTWLMDIGWELFGGGGIFLIATAYGLIFLLMGRRLWEKENFKIPAGLLVTMAVCMVPLAIYGLETYFNLWPTDQQEQYRDFYSLVEGRWVFMEIGTILAGIIALRFFSFPFLTAPIFFSAWFLTLDIVPFLLGKEISWEHKCWISLCLGLALIVISFFIDRSKKEDYAFWGYLFGTLSFWLGLNCLVWDKGHFVLFVYLIINLIMMGLSILVRRNVLMIFGAIGVFAYLSYLTHEIFQDSILFPFILSAIGLGIIYLGILYQRNLKWIESNITEKLPARVRNFLNR